LTTCCLIVPRLSLSQEFGKLGSKYAELVVPWVAHDPEVKPALLLMIPSCSAECFEALNFGFEVVSLQVKVHAFFRDLFVAGRLQEDPYVGVGKAEPTVDVAARGGQRFLGGVEYRGPEMDSLIKVRYVDDEMTKTASMHRSGLFRIN
jgi:hypothetical protein